VGADSKERLGGVSFNQFDPIQDTESRFHLADAGVVCCVSTNSIRFSIL